MRSGTSRTRLPDNLVPREIVTRYVGVFIDRTKARRGVSSHMKTKEKSLDVRLYESRTSASFPHPYNVNPSNKRLTGCGWNSNRRRAGFRVRASYHWRCVSDRHITITVTLKFQQQQKTRRPRQLRTVINGSAVLNARNHSKPLTPSDLSLSLSDIIHLAASNVSGPAGSSAVNWIKFPVDISTKQCRRTPPFVRVVGGSLFRSLYFNSVYGLYSNLIN